MLYPMHIVDLFNNIHLKLEGPIRLALSHLPPHSANIGSIRSDNSGAIYDVPYSTNTYTDVTSRLERATCLGRPFISRDSLITW